MPVTNEDEKYIYIDGTPVAKAGLSSSFLEQLKSGEAKVSSAKTPGKRAPLRSVHEQDGVMYLNDGTRANVTDNPELAAALRAGVQTVKMPEQPSFLDKTKDFVEQAVVPSVLDTQRDLLMGPVGAVNAVKGLDSLGDQGIVRGAKNLARGVGAGAQQIGHALAPNLVDAPTPYIPPGAKLTPQAQPELAALESQGRSGAGGNPSLGPLGIPNYVMAALPNSQDNEVSMRVQTPGVVPAGGGGGYMGAINKAQRDQETAIRDAAAVGAAKAAEQHGFEQERTRQMEQQQLQQQELLKRAKFIRDEQVGKIRKMTDDLANMPTTVDPRRLWNSMGTADKLTAALGVFLGGLGGGSNQALGIVQNAVQQDIDAQREAIANSKDNAKARLDAENSLYGHMLGQLQDDQAALLATHLGANQLVEQKVNALSSKYASPEMKAKADQTIAVLRADTAAKRAELGIRLEQLGLERAKLGMAQLELQQKSGAGGVMDRERFVPGEGYALDKEAAKKARGLQAGRNKLIPIVQQMLALAKDKEFEVLDRDAVARGKVLAGNALFAIKEMENAGALDSGSVEQISKLIPEDPLSLGLSTQAQLQEVINTFDQSYRNQLKSYMDPTASMQPPSTFRSD